MGLNVAASALVERDDHVEFRDLPFTGIGVAADTNGQFTLVDYIAGRPSGESVVLPIDLDLSTATVEAEFDYWEGDTVVAFQGRPFDGTEFVFEGDFLVAAVGHRHGKSSGNELNWNTSGQLIALSRTRHWPELGVVGEGYRWHDDGTLAATSVEFGEASEGGLVYDGAGQVIALTCQGDYFERIKLFESMAQHRVWRGAIELETLQPANTGLAKLQLGGLDQSTETAIVDWVTNHRVNNIRRLDLIDTFDENSIRRLSTECAVERLSVTSSSTAALDAILEAKRNNSSLNAVYNRDLITSVDELADDFVADPPKGYVFDRDFEHLVGIRAYRTRLDESSLASLVATLELRYVWLATTEDSPVVDQTRQLKRQRPDVDVRINGQPVSRLSMGIGTGAS